MTAFNPFMAALRQLNYTGRWSTVPMIRPNNTAQHSYWVAVYTHALLKISNNPKWSPAFKYTVLSHALFHDAPEAVYGDILGPVKRAAVVAQALDEFAEAGMASVGLPPELGTPPTIAVDPELEADIRNIVKAANIIDDTMILSEEAALGNKKLNSLIIENKKRLYMALRKAGFNGEVYEQVLDAAHAVECDNFTILQNHSDLT